MLRNVIGNFLRNTKNQIYLIDWRKILSNLLRMRTIEKTLLEKPRPIQQVRSVGRFIAEIGVLFVAVVGCASKNEAPSTNELSNREDNKEGVQAPLSPVKAAEEGETEEGDIETLRAEVLALLAELDSLYSEQGKVFERIGDPAGVERVKQQKREVETLKEDVITLDRAGLEQYKKNVNECIDRTKHGNAVMTDLIEGLLPKGAKKVDEK